MKMENEHIIREWWEKNKTKAAYLKILDAQDFWFQNTQNALKKWMEPEFAADKLDDVIKGAPTSNKVNRMSFFNEEERKVVDDICGKLPIGLDQWSHKNPIIWSLGKYKKGELKDNNGHKKNFLYCLEPNKYIPIKPDELKDRCNKLGLDSNTKDEDLIKVMDDLNLPDCKCKNPLNQSLLYMHMLYNAFGEKNNSQFENNQINEKKIMNEYVVFLLNNHNIILHGAPGTGKTYLAKKIAKQLIFGDAERNLESLDDKTQFNEQCCLVQFHQSYDYTDFVEGLRPKNGDNGQIGFERKDGAFKEFCKKAISDSSIEKAIETFKSKVKENNQLEIKSIRSDTTFIVKLGEKNAITINNTPTTVSSDSVKGYIKNCKYDKGHDTYDPAVAQYIKDKCMPSYVFIIDEINRGEMSKIFGELFYSIDPGYRGAEGKIKTQYANLQEKPNEFDLALGIEKNEIEKDGKKDDLNKGNYGHFFVPENVYIIGTMNDIDRSVDSMDFAMRRRFAFKEITAESRKGMLDQLGDKQNIAEKVMVALNKEIEKVPGLSSAYHIGPAYFLKLKIYEGDFVKLWNNHIAGVVWEYLRGMPKADDLFKTLEKVFNEAVASTPKKLDTETATPAEAADEDAGEGGNA